MSEFAPVIYVDVYQTKPRARSIADAGKGPRPQTWRWRAISEGNRKKLATSGEAYTNLADCVHAVNLLFGSGSNVFLRQEERGNQLLRAPSVSAPF